MNFSLTLYQIWIQVPTDRPKKDSDEGEVTDKEDTESPEKLRLKAIIEKKSMINLVREFVINYLLALLSSLSG